MMSDFFDFFENPSPLELCFDTVRLKQANFKGHFFSEVGCETKKEWKKVIFIYYSTDLEFFMIFMDRNRQPDNIE